MGGAGVSVAVFVFVGELSASGNSMFVIVSLGPSVTGVVSSVMDGLSLSRLISGRTTVGNGPLGSVISGVGASGKAVPAVSATVCVTSTSDTSVVSVVVVGGSGEEVVGCCPDCAVVDVSGERSNKAVYRF